MTWPMRMPRLFREAGVNEFLMIDPAEESVGESAGEALGEIERLRLRNLERLV